MKKKDLNKETNVTGLFINKKFYPKINLQSGVIRVVLSTICNYKCPHCFQEGEDINSHRSLKADDIISLFSFAKDNYGVHTARLTGGEPLVYNDLFYLIKKLHQIGINVDFTTNGLLFEKNITALKNSNIKIITVTLNTLDANLYSKLSGSSKDNLDKVLRGITLVKEAGIVININLTALDNDRQNVFDVIEYAAKNNFVIRICEPSYVIGSKDTKEKINFNKIKDKLIKEAEKVLYSACESVIYIKHPKNNKITIMNNLCDNRYCGSCSKYLYLRLTSDFKLKPCLSRKDTEVQIKSLSNKDLHEAFLLAIDNMGNGLQNTCNKGLDFSNR